MSGYKIYRADHPSGNRKGGSAIFVNNKIQHNELPPIQEDEFQIARVAVLIDGKSYQIGSFYSAPGNRITSLSVWGFVHEMGMRFLLGGDFNSKHPRWGSNTSNPRGRLLHYEVYRLGLDVLHPLEPTHYPSTPAQSPDVLDIFIGKHIQQYCTLPQVLHELSSDHFPVTLTISKYTPPKLQEYNLIKHPFNWKKYSAILNDLTNTQVPLKTKRDIDAAISTLTNNIHFAANESSSTLTRNIIQNRTQYPIHITQLHEVKKEARKLWEQTKYPPHKRNYNRATRELKEALKDLNRKAMQSHLTSLDNEDGSLWRKTKCIIKHVEQIPPLKKGNKWLTTPQEKVNEFSNILSQQFTPNITTNHIFTEHIMQSLEQPLQLSPFNAFFTPSSVKHAIKKSPIRKAPGKDRIIQPLLKQFPRKTLVYLTQIYNAMLRLAYFPTSWKHAHIIMIPKPNKRQSDPTSYRPISLLPFFSKIFERLWLPKLMTYLEKLLPDTQFGFRQQHSCPQQLHRVVDEILDTYEQKQVCLGLFLDTEKAFDKVWHAGLLYKVKQHLPDTYYRLLQSYLSERTYSVTYKGAISRSKPINSGVPQGSVIGPFLYLVYTSDLPRSNTLTIAQFADDIAVLSRARNTTTAAAHLQTYTDRIEHWNRRWRMSMNAHKSSIICFTYLKTQAHFTVTLNNTPIPEKQSVTYLGLTLDQRLTWHIHIQQTVQRLRTRLYMLKHMLHKHSTITLQNKLLIYIMLLKPIWQYGCAIWGSAADSNILKIQRFQNRTLRLITTAPWYIQNTSIHLDLHIKDVNSTIETTYTRLHLSMTHHPNPLLQNTAQHQPPPRIARRLKRKHHTDNLEPIEH